MICPSCGKEIDGNLKFCSDCGGSLQNHYCTSCGSTLNAEQKFCIKCGTPNPYYAVNVNKATGGGFPVYSQATAPVQNQPAAPIQQPQATAPIQNYPETPVQNYTTVPVQPEPQVPIQSEPEAHTQNHVPDSNEAQATSNITNENQLDEERTTDVSYEPEAIGKGNGAGKLMLVLFLLLILGGGAMVLGERLGWWDIQALSWAKSEEQKEMERLHAKMMQENVAAMMESGTAQQEETVDEYVEMADEPEEAEVGNQPCSVTLPGLIGGKYGVEMMLDGYSNTDGFYPETGKYRYTKYEGAWIALNIEVERVSNQISYLKIKEYSDGNLSGTWDVCYDQRYNTLKGTMTNAKGDSYDVSMGVGTISDGYHKISGDVVTDTKRFPFYIDFKYDKGMITEAEYHNPNYSVAVKLPEARLANDEFYFEGSSNGKTLKICFSSNAPYVGTMDDGSSVLKIEMNL